MMSKEKVWSIVAREALCLISDHRRLIQTVLAVLFVPVSVLLVLDQRLPFPRPGERPLFAERGWPESWMPAIRRARPVTPRPAGDAVRAAEAALPSGSAAAVGATKAEPLGGPAGGETYTPPRLSLMSYRVKPGDTLEKIAARLGMELDTISSLNRPGGKGVHNLEVGERIAIPNQDGIFIVVKDDFEALCAKYNLASDEVLAANSLSRGDVAPATRVFFPGAKHEGYELSLAYGVAIASPLRGGWLTSRFGRRADPFTGEPTRHRGIDIAASEGTVVRSASDGRVSFAGYNEVLGNFVEVRSPLGFQYIYGHFSAILVASGARIYQGTPIGRVGATGHATGPHLHFEVWKDGVPQNPLRFLPGIR
jgi:murein DD-endopeptidase MepM/ murein hydrolase activator NlpD